MPTFNLRTPSISSAFSMKRDVNKWVNKAKLSVKAMEERKLYNEPAKYVRDEMRKYIWANQAKVGSYYIYYDPETNFMKRTYRPKIVKQYRNKEVSGKYHIGNLMKSIKILHKLKRSPYKIVGPRRAKKLNSKVTYGTNYSNAYSWYAHIVDRGTTNKKLGRNIRPMNFINNTKRATGHRVRQMLIQSGTRALRRRAIKYGIAS